MPLNVVHFYAGSGVLTTPGYSIFLTPWMDKGKAVVGTSPTLNQTSAALGGGNIFENPPAINDSVSWDIWLDTGTYKLSLIHTTQNDIGIYSMQLNSVAQGTIDGYAAGATGNVYTEITGIAVTSGSKTFKFLMSSKNASSSNYKYAVNTIAWLRTGA